MNIEVEIRSFISENKHKELLKFFRKHGKFISRDYQETYYFDSKQDLRIQRNDFYSKIWLKKGRIHDQHREEIEVKFSRKDFEKLENLFRELGFKVKIKWFRTRNTFKWESINVMLDYTKGYGHIIELEKMSDEKDKEKILISLKQKLQGLGIPLTPREEFDKKFEYYKKHWKGR